MHFLAPSSVTYLAHSNNHDSIPTLEGDLYKLRCFCLPVRIVFPQSTAGIAQSNDLGDRGSIPRRGTYFSLLHNVQTGSGAHPASYSMGTEVSFSGVKRPEHEAVISPSSADVCSYTSTPPYILII
jgi:hypothetical protein